MRATLGPVLYGRSLLRGYVAELHRLGIIEEMRARASGELLPLLDDPRRAPAWVKVALLDELIAALAALRGRDAVREMGYRAMKEGGLATVLEPIIHLTVSVLGGGPGSLFARAQLMASVISRGVELTWTPGGNAGGVMKIRCDERIPELSWAPWEGAFLYSYDLTGSSGEVAQARPAADGGSCEIDLSWTPK